MMIGLAWMAAGIAIGLAMAALVYNATSPARRPELSESPVCEICSSQPAFRTSRVYFTPDHRIESKSIYLCPKCIRDNLSFRKANPDDE